MHLRYVSTLTFEVTDALIHSDAMVVAVIESKDSSPKGIVRTTNTGTVEVGGSVTGEVEVAGDADWFAVTLEAGKTYQIILEGSPTDRGTLNDPLLYGVYDADSNFLPRTKDDNSGMGANSRVLFTPEQDGTYYLSAGGQSGEIGTYTLSVRELVDEFSDDSETVGAIEPDSSITGEIGKTGDEDWFAITLLSGRTYHIDLEGSATDRGSLDDPLLQGVFDSSGSLIEGTHNDDGGQGYNSRIVFTPQEDGTYYLSAGGLNSTGTYLLSVTVETAANKDTTGTVEVGSSVVGAIDLSGDVDWFAVTLEAEKSYRIDLEGSSTNGGTLGNPYLRGVYDAEGNLISETSDISSGFGSNSRVIFTPEEDGIYYVAAGHFGGIGTYLLSVEAYLDVTADTDTTGTVEVGAIVRGEVDFDGDSDWFAVTLEAEKSYRIDLEGSSTNGGTLGNPHLRGVYDAEGNLISETSDISSGFGSNSQVIFTPEEDGIYYVAAGHSGGIGTYLLSVEAYLDVTADDTDTTGTVEVGAIVRGEVDFYGDSDWFAVTLEAEKSYRIDLEGSSTNGGTLGNPYLGGVYDAEGNLISETSDISSGFGSNSQVIFTPREDGIYYVAAGHWGGIIGTYLLSVTFETAANKDTTGSIEVGGSVRDQIDFYDDSDWFAVTLEAEKSYRIDLEGSSTSRGTLQYPYFHGIHDAEGNPIPGTSDYGSGTGYNSRVIFTPEEDGTYYVAAGSIGRMGSYSLSVYVVIPATTGAIELDGSVIGEIDSLREIDWFSLDLEGGKTYRIDLEGSSTSRGTLQNPYLRGVHDAEGRPVAGTSDDDSGAGTNSRVVFTPEEDGTYYVAAGTDGSEIGSYSLSVDEVIPPTTGSIEVGGSAIGEIDFSREIDWFAVTLEAGKTYRIDLEGNSTSQGTLDNPHLRGVHDGEGRLIPGTLDNGSGAGTNSQVLFTPEENGTYYVAASGQVGYTGTFTLYVREHMDDFGDLLKSTEQTGDTVLDASGVGDTVNGTDADEVLNGGPGDDLLIGAGGDDILNGNEGNDTLEGGSGDDTLNGGPGYDLLSGGAGADVINGGQGGGLADYSLSDAAVTVNLSTGVGSGGHAQGDRINDIQDLTGSIYDDTLNGNKYANRLSGGAGNDVLYGREEDDWISGGPGEDTLYGNEGRQNVLAGGSGADLLDGQGGRSIADYTESNEAVNVNLVTGVGSGGDAEGDQLNGILGIWGSSYDDTLIGGVASDEILGGNGDDFISGGAGADDLQGGRGSDYLKGGAGADRIDGGPDHDTIDYGDSPAAVQISLSSQEYSGGHATGDRLDNIEAIWGSPYDDLISGDWQDNWVQGRGGNDTIRGHQGHDTLSGGAGDDDIDGGGGDDDLNGGPGNDIVKGDWGNDTINGGSGDDRLEGGGGKDTINGGSGHDTLIGGDGEDTLHGGSGYDDFVFDYSTRAGSYNTISDFTDGEDRIHVTLAGVTSFEDLTLTAVRGGIEIDMTAKGGGKILLKDFELDDLDATDFVFAKPADNSSVGHGDAPATTPNEGSTFVLGSWPEAIASNQPAETEDDAISRVDMGDDEILYVAELEEFWLDGNDFLL